MLEQEEYNITERTSSKRQQMEHINSARQVAEEREKHDRVVDHDLFDDIHQQLDEAAMQ